MLRLRRTLLPKVRAEAPYGRFATPSIRSGGPDRLSDCRFGELWHFPGNGLRTSVLYARFLVFGLRLCALALPALLRRMQQRASRSTNRETEFNCCHFHKILLWVMCSDQTLRGKSPLHSN